MGEARPRQKAHEPQHCLANESTTCVCSETPGKEEEKEKEGTDEDQEEGDKRRKKYGPTGGKVTGRAHRNSENSERKK